MDGLPGASVAELILAVTVLLSVIYLKSNKILQTTRQRLGMTEILFTGTLNDISSLRTKTDMGIRKEMSDVVKNVT